MHLPAELLKDAVQLLCNATVETTDLTYFIIMTHTFIKKYVIFVS